MLGLYFSSSLKEQSKKKHLAAGAPLLWSAGTRLIYFPRGGQGEPAFMDYQYKPVHGMPMVISSEQRVTRITTSCAVNHLQLQAAVVMAR